MLGSCRNHPDEIGILELESEKREEIREARPAACFFFCASKRSVERCGCGSKNLKSQRARRFRRGRGERHLPQSMQTEASDPWLVAESHRHKRDLQGLFLRKEIWRRRG
jgi:hypothetical protein